MKKIPLWLLAYLLIRPWLYGQSAPDSSYFISPVQHDIRMAGSFGELRSTHFHAGIDIKPSTTDHIGDPILAVADGYVSRIKIQTGGYGQALYIDHNNGHTSVYAHLDQLADTLAQYVASIQRATQSYEVDLYPDSAAFQVRQGEVIGTMGNTGRSYAPHLHFEIRHTQTETPQDPCLWGIGASDHKKPTLQSIGIEMMTPDLQVIDQVIHYPSGSSTRLTIPAWRVGLDVQAFDQMDGSTNHNGVYLRQIYVDDTLHWQSRTDSIRWDETRYIRSYYDYTDKKDLNRTAVCGYVWPGSPVSIYQKKGGPIALYSGQDRHIKVILQDLAGNTTTYQLLLRRAKEVTPAPAVTYNTFVRWDSSYTIGFGRTTVEIDSATFDRDVRLSYEQQEDEIRLHHANHPIFGPIQMTTQVLDTSYARHLCLVHTDERRPTTYGGIIQGHNLSAPVKALGHYRITLDTIAPTITPLRSTAKARYYTVDDNLSSRGTAKEVQIDVYMNGQWQITPYKVMTKVLTVPTTHLPIGRHHLLIRVEDDRGNVTEWEEAIQVEA